MRARDIQKALIHPEKIFSLNLSRAKPKLEKIPDSIFAFSNLKILNLSNNNLRHISKEVYEAFPLLEELNISGNQIENIKPGTESLSGLSILVLSGNPILKLPCSANWRNLKELDISRTKIRELPPEMIKWRSLKKIKTGRLKILRKQADLILSLVSDSIRLHIPFETSKQFYEILRKRNQKLISRLNVRDLFFAANSSLSLLRGIALVELESRKALKCELKNIHSGMDISMTGRIYEVNVLAKKMEKMGAKLSTKSGPDSNIFLIGDYPYFQGLPRQKQVHLFTQRSLMAQLDKRFPPFEGSDSEEEFAGKMRRLMANGTKENLEIAFGLIANRGCPVALLSDLLIFSFHNPDFHFRERARKILEIYGSSELMLWLREIEKQPLPGPKIHIRSWLVRCRKCGLDSNKIESALFRQSGK